MTNDVAARLPRVGCVYRPQWAPERLGRVAKAADDAGVDELWLWEDCFLAGGISSAAIALSHSANLAVGVGVLPVPMRNAALTAMEIAALSRSFPGRARIGVGHGVQEWMAQIGEKVNSPMTLLREHLTSVAALLRGERVSVDGRYVQLNDVALDWPPLDPGIELLAAATGPKTLRLSGELASGTVLTCGTTPEALRAAVEQIRIGQASNLRSQAHSVVVNVLCTTGPTARQDFLAEVEHWQFDPDGDVGAYGSAADVASAAQRWLDAGADTVVLQPTANADIEQFVGFVGSEVQPLIRAAAGRSA